MKQEFKLPDIGEGIHEAELLEWKVAVGDAVKEDDEIGVFSTDKVTVELPSPCSGTIVSLHGAIGDVIEVGTVLAVIERVGAAAKEAAPKQNGAARDRANGKPTPVAEAQAAAPAAQPAMTTFSARHSSAPPGGPVVAAPSTRRMARELGVNLTDVPGSGPNGRILRNDVQAAADGLQQVAQSPAPVQTRAARGFEDEPGTRRVRLAGARAVSAKNLAMSVQQSVTTTSTFEVPGDGFLALMARLKPQAEKRGLKLSPVHLMAKCVGAALANHERFNATIDEQANEIILHDRVDLGVAVAAGDKLVVPVIRGVEQRLLFDVVSEVAAVAERARDNRLSVADFKGGTFTLSSTGGLERAQMVSTRPIISPPQTAILWVSRIMDRPRVIDGQLSAGPMMTCSLSFDHRYIDGAEATVFINELADNLAHPEQAIA